MKAFMSEPGDGALYFDGDTLAYADGRTFAAPYWGEHAAEAIRLSQHAAEVEARAILRETEAGTWPWNGPWDGAVFGHRTPFGPAIVCRSDARDALAEALAAFVGEGE